MMKYFSIPHHVSLLCLTALVAVTLLPCTTLRASSKQTAGILPAAADKVLADLDAKSYNTRAAMTRSLLADPKLTQSAIKKLMDQCTSPEQANRLLEVARHLAIRNLARKTFGKNGSGSLGLTHASVPANTYPWLHHGAIQVLLTAPGFPAYAHLEPGDIIVGFNGKPFGESISAEQFKSVIEKHKQGDKVSMTIHRDDKDIVISLRLGSSQALGAMYQLVDGKLVLSNQYAGHWLDIRNQLLVHFHHPPATLPLQEIPATQ